MGSITSMAEIPIPNEENTLLLIILNDTNK